MKPIDTAKLQLAHYHCSFFLPLYGLEASGFKPKPDQRHHYGNHPFETCTETADAEAWHYFSPALRNILFDRQRASRPIGPAPVQEWRLPDEDTVWWILKLDDPDDARSLSLPIDSVMLYRYFNGIYILNWRIRANTPLEMEQALHFTRMVRILFPSFSEQSDEGKIQPQYLIDTSNPENDKYLAQAFTTGSNIAWPETIGEQISPIVKYLLSCFATDAKQLADYWRTTTQFYDDRLFVSAAYGLAQKDIPTDALRKLYSLAFHVDRHQDGFNNIGGHAYSPAELYPRLDEQTLWLWKEIGSYFGYSDAANIYLGSGDFFLNTLAPKHVPHIYDRMLLQALFYQATLRQFDQQLTNDTPPLLATTDLETIKRHRDHFVRFTNVYWFHNMTEQMQGKEIFRLQQQALGLQTHYAIIKDELERTDEFLRIIDTQRADKINRRITRWGGTFAIISIWYTILGQLHDYWTDTTTSNLWAWLGHWLDSTGNHDNWLGLILAVVVIPIVLALFWNLFLHRRS